MVHRGDFERLSIKASSFKCFGTTPQGFGQFKRVNVIIGRNNSGKSALLDLLEVVHTGQKIPPSYHRTAPRETAIIASTKFEMWDAALNQVRHHQYVGNVVSRNILESSGKAQLGGLRGVGDPQVLRTINKGLVEFRGRKLKRIAAERNVVPEAHQTNSDTGPDVRSENGSV